MEHDDTGDVRQAERTMEREIDDLDRQRERLDQDIERSRRELEELREVIDPRDRRDADDAAEDG